MKTIDDDSKLREMIREIKLESPGKDFTLNVLDRIHKEVPFTFQIKKEPLLGKGFWIIVLLFIVLGTAMFVLSGTAGSPEGTIGKFLESVGNNPASGTYRNLMNQLNNVPAGITGILLASSLLIFIERFLSIKRIKA